MANLFMTPIHNSQDMNPRTHARTPSVKEQCHLKGKMIDTHEKTDLLFA